MHKVARVLLVAVLGYGLSPLASAEIFTVAPGSIVQLSGNLQISVVVPGVGTLTGSGNFAQQGPGGLDGQLSGTVVADAGGSTLNFPGGGQIDVVNSGPWQPSNLPGAFGFTVHADLTGGPPNSFFDFVGNIRDLKVDLVGSTTLSGAAGNQTFNTSGLNLVTLNGFLDSKVTACVSAICDTQTPEPQDLTSPQSPLDALPGGTLITIGNTRTLSIPFRISDTETQEETNQGVTVSLTLATLLESPPLSPIVATAAIPEPSTWAALLVGLLGLAASTYSARTGRRY